MNATIPNAAPARMRLSQRSRNTARTASTKTGTITVARASASLVTMDPAMTTAAAAKRPVRRRPGAPSPGPVEPAFQKSASDSRPPAVVRASKGEPVMYGTADTAVSTAGSPTKRKATAPAMRPSMPRKGRAAAQTPQATIVAHASPATYGVAAPGPRAGGVPEYPPG